MSFQMLHVKSLIKLKAVVSSKNLAHLVIIITSAITTIIAATICPCSIITTKLF